jgi:TusA-related sulfurtransferase
VFRCLSLVVGLSVFVAGCEGCEKKPSPVDAGPAVGVTSPSADADAEAHATTPSDAGAKHEMGNCPTSVAGTEVVIKDVEGGVDVSITGKDEAATREIRERVKKLGEAEARDAGGGTRHDHSGSGGGRTGRCAIIMRNTTLVTADIPKGSRLVVTAQHKDEVDWLRRETREREREARSAAAEGAGSQRMAHCPSAIEGTKTQVRDSKEGAIVVVTGPPPKLAEIRSRARHAAEVAKKGDAGKIEHSGEGTGGGGLGRCPIVVEGDTTVEVREIDEGVEVEVKTKKDVAALQKEVKARAAAFMR